MARVLFWSELFSPYIGGAEVFATGLLQDLANQGHEFLVVTSHAELSLPDEETTEYAHVLRLPMRAAIANHDVRLLARTLHEVSGLKRQFAPELVHVHSIGPSLLFHLRTRPQETPWIAGLQNEVLASQRDRNDSLLSSSLRSASWVVGCSQAVTEQARKLVPAISKHSSTIYNGIDAGPFSSASVPERPVIVYLGRLVPAKGVDTLLEALAILVKHVPEVRLVVTGDGSERSSLERQALELGVGGSVEFRGWVDPEAASDSLREAAVVAMPSRGEGLPLVAIQAALLGRPIVASRVGGLPEIVIDGETGWLVEPDRPDELASALEGALRERATALQRGAAARARALSEMTLDRSAARFDDLYTRLVTESR